MGITNLSAREIASQVSAGELSGDDVLGEHLKHIERLDSKVQAFLEVNNESIESAKTGPLAGVPVAVKDNICTNFLPTTAGSKILEGHRPTYNATVVERIINAGGTIIGKTNLDEFAMGSSTEYSAFQPSFNPRDTSLSPGGSSGGSVAAVVSGMVPLALGSDTGGSIRQPCSMCGAVGFKSTYGRTSRYGLIAFAPSLDQIGAVGRNVGDVALLTSVIAGYDPKEATSAKKPVEDYATGLDNDLGKLNIALISEFFDENVDDDVRAGVEKALTGLTDMGHNVDRASFPDANLALPCYFIVACAEAYSNLARYDGVLFANRPDEYEGLLDMIAGARGDGFGPEVMRRIISGAYVLQVGYQDQYYGKAQILRRFLRRRFDAIFDDYDFIISPVSPFTAFPVGDRMTDPQQMYLADIYTSLANLVGIPAISIPCEISPKPVGFQIFSRNWDEARLFALAHQLEEKFDLNLNPIDPI